MAIKRSKRAVAGARIATTARRLLDASSLCAIATVSPAGQAHVNTAYFAWSREFELFWLSDPRSEHSRSIHSRPTVAIAVYDSGQSWGQRDRGIQLFGSAREVQDPAAEAETLYAKRFPEYRREELAAYRFYAFHPRRLKLFDESEFGPGTFVTARVVRPGRLVWQRTEIYRVTG